MSGDRAPKPELLKLTLAALLVLILLHCNVAFNEKPEDNSTIPLTRIPSTSKVPLQLQIKDVATIVLLSSTALSILLLALILVELHVKTRQKQQLEKQPF